MPSYRTWASGSWRLWAALRPQLLLYPTCPQRSRLQLGGRGWAHDKSEGLRCSSFTVTFHAPGARHRLPPRKQRQGTEPTISLHFQHVSEEPRGSFLWFECLARTGRQPGPNFVMPLLLIEKKEKGSCGLLRLLQVTPPLPIFPFDSAENRTLRSYFF